MSRIARAFAPSRLREDDGFGLILAVASGMIAMVIVMTITAIGMNSLQSSHQHVNFENALSAAEAGIDAQLSLIQAANDQSPPADYVTPAPCNASTAPPSGATAERDWAKAVIAGLPAQCFVTTPDGTYAAFRPAGKQTVYSMGWSPSRGGPHAKQRLLKAEYLFGPFKPGNAILTDGTLNFSGSVTVDYTDPANAASVHSNGSITANGSGSLTVEGAISASGSNAIAGSGGSCPSGVTGPCTASAPLERNYVPMPRDIYNAVATSTPQWYDLCPDGSVQLPTVTSPCAGTNVISPSGKFNGWTYTAGSSTAPPVWTLQRQSGTTTYPGVYYVYHGNALVGDAGNDATTWQITVLAESGRVGDPDVPSGYTNTATCGKYGGNIDWRLFTIQNFLQGTVFDAEGTLSGTANTDAGDGLFAAGDNVNLQSSSNTLTGAIVAGNKCPAAGGNNVQGATVHYDRDAQVPISSLIDTTLWLEYVG